ncbi:MAG: hypothetical protein A3I07_01180 [Candidatus Doudnabacteria bacterium RIFCSPLOWO2_02_FULL_42_9]|uniref:ABC transporter ATP-binding protein n=1 Tax=Candidatus Doudnabacteria bacterium RIFCSPHIGHO2_01_FULL_41_86 TaxID=1817821 RepID=A0A1F5N884_9BACT|nr:MAG: hypothetical protein A2717_04510 [Candidatus Doudnabacteria bacterium RIFCSPHIGHO2_01_FULL_41_86]OGE75875.1 MAG: hypothetical protein A3K07_04105 [Candidatus Doudnabacteria bacterium RIFCSPHIGHO2_01_43_10]OGE86249.1 MAG: hypothetical protein A3E28_03865 [Candidatus Doudnabacteria bacterium RIFCSPHIGHO2_12_FULL_42_22]OGE87097.1 MAG: hypothetical protein A3C49_03530 [Candidatus Doudnabacteria bacterium RIFCSPHIGHO2_02_FULL_42_25]OGE92237.1 MAG: hypothetical protein A2895_04215 [Candidatus
MKYKGVVFVLFIGTLALVAFDVIKPFFYKRFFDQLVVTDPANTSPLISTIFLILLLNFFNYSAWRGVLYVSNFFQPRVMSDLLNTCYEYIQNHSYRFFTDNFVGSLVTKVRRYQNSFETIADQAYLDIGRTILITISIIAATLVFNPMIGFIVLGWSLIYLTFTVFFNRYKLKFDLKRASQDTKTTAQLADTITNNINLKIFTSNSKELKTFRGITQELYEMRKKSWDLANHAEIFQGTLVILLEFGVMYYAISQWQQGLMSIGGFALVQAYLGRIFEKFWNIGKNIQKIYEALADAAEMTVILNTPHEVKDGYDSTNLKIKQGTIQFDRVSFAYNEQEVFTNFNLRIQEKQKVALIGPSGGGKSTIVKLLFRFFDLQSGRILIDGQDISKVKQDSLRRQIGLVPQDPVLFHRSLLENIRYGKPSATEEEVIKASKYAHCHEFISNFPQGYDTFVGERGVKLSGGERQRVAIARAILKNAPILVLDEATSSLDSESEIFIQDALKTLMEGKTTIVIAHRLSTIMRMDRIIVIEDGKVIEEGKHEELVKAKQGTYQKLWEIQAGGFNGA